MSSHDDREKIVAAMGGTRGLLDSGVPSLVFLIVFTVTKDVRESGIFALALSLIFAQIGRAHV